MKFHPFANESESDQIDELNIENRLDRVAIYGSLDITKDKAGLKNAKKLSSILEQTIKALESEKDLPDHITVEIPQDVKNPFSQ